MVWIYVNNQGNSNQSIVDIGIALHISNNIDNISERQSLTVTWLSSLYVNTLSIYIPKEYSPIIHGQKTGRNKILEKDEPNEGPWLLYRTSSHLPDWKPSKYCLKLNTSLRPGNTVALRRNSHLNSLCNNCLLRSPPLRLLGIWSRARNSTLG